MHTQVLSAFRAVHGSEAHGLHLSCMGKEIKTVVHLRMEGGVRRRFGGGGGWKRESMREKE